MEGFSVINIDTNFVSLHPPSHHGCKQVSKNKEGSYGGKKLSNYEGLEGEKVEPVQSDVPKEVESNDTEWRRFAAYTSFASFHRYPRHWSLGNPGIMPSLDSDWALVSINSRDHLLSMSTTDSVGSSDTRLRMHGPVDTLQEQLLGNWRQIVAYNYRGMADKHNSKFTK